MTHVADHELHESICWQRQDYIMTSSDTSTTTCVVVPCKLTSNILHPSTRRPQPPTVVSADGCYLILDDGRRIFEASGGPAVTCIGHGNSEVAEAVSNQMRKVSYCFSLYYSNLCAEELAKVVLASTNGAMAKATFMSSGIHRQIPLKGIRDTLELTLHRLRSSRGCNEACGEVFRRQRPFNQDHFHCS